MCLTGFNHTQGDNIVDPKQPFSQLAPPVFTKLRDCFESEAQSSDIVSIPSSNVQSVENSAVHVSD
jgi:hypothetical protein